MNKQHGRENDSVEVAPATEKSDVALREESIQTFWKERDIFNKTLATPGGGAPTGDYVFYDGPPFATGTPHYGHILAGTIKDAIPRFWTMQGKRVERKWGWDCHGLPLENLIEKKLGLATKRDIETFGVKNFNEAARGAVMEFADEWKRVVPRLGRFADMENDYRTMDSPYTESVWWVFKSLHEKGLVFEGYKAMHLCPRCGTTLSNFEVNLGYKDIKDIAVTVKLPLLDEAGKVTDTSLLVWTTTPWTLPGNMAAAINREFDYVTVAVTVDGVTERLVLAKGRLAQLGTDQYEIIETFKGATLEGRRYEPPFPYWQDQDFKDKAEAWKIWHADYVELGEEGTGAVHIAPAYGEDDLQLAKANSIPIVHHVDGNGRFVEAVTGFAGLLVKPKDDEKAEVSHLDTDIEIVKALKERGRLFRKENITHSYPHCWRCDTPLLNYATTSWFVDVPKIKDQLVAENAHVNWVPDHVGTNRFGKWLEGARDWAVSRQRYWGAPLPIWKHPETGDYKVIGSLAELQQYAKPSQNRYFLMRHAEANSNVSGVISSVADEGNTLTETGKEQCRRAALNLREAGITRIVHSGLRRARETGELVAAELGLPLSAVTADARLTELQVGAAYEGKTWSEFEGLYTTEAEKFTKEIDGVESRRDIIKRVGEFLYEVDMALTGETVLLIGHASSLFGLECAAAGLNLKDAIARKQAGYQGNAEVRELPFVPLPHNEWFELDFHRPYIDDFAVFGADGTRLVRVPDVFDCWFESGSMPYGQHHYPFAGNEADFLGKKFPAQFIAEGLDQTRGWFYSLIVLGVALFGRSPYENVIVNGLVLAEDGRKMSKSLRNYPDPMELVDRVGADAMRLYLLTSPVVRGEDLNFSEKEVLELQRKTIGRLHNVLLMYQMYAAGEAATDESAVRLDQWIISRLRQLVVDSEAGYRSYELDKATRPIIDFIDDVSVWYLRRSRERLKGEDAADKGAAASTLRYVLSELAKVMAPVMPFYAEYLYQAVRSNDAPESVHLTRWPETKPVDQGLVDQMSEVRLLVTAALQLRTASGVKVRQPLSRLTVKTSALANEPELFHLIKDELNVKHIEVDQALPTLVTLDTALTPDLIAEGAANELIRAIQDLRKRHDLVPTDSITVLVATDELGRRVVADFETAITKVVGASTIVHQAWVDGVIVAAEPFSFTIAISQDAP